MASLPPSVELRKPLPEENNHRYDSKSRSYVGERFDRGERIIMVDGARWGRTIVTSHGCHGTKHVFKQDRGEVLMDSKYPTEIAIRSQKRRHWDSADKWRPTEEMVLEKAKELVVTGKLRDPTIVQREHEKAMERFRQRTIEAEQERAAAFRAKAMEALQINDPTSEIIGRVVAAMEWAKEQ